MTSGNSFFAELKRRNVLRAAALYAAGAWLLVQIVTQVGPVFDLPPATQRWIIIAAIIGFPFAMALSWFYELTPEGFRREGDAEIPDTIRHSSGRKLDFAIIGVLALAVVLLLADRFVLHRDAKGITAEAAPERSIAVLPFRNLSTDKDNGYFADALGEEIINSLARTPDLRVASRTASFGYRESEKAIAEIAAKLGVATLLEGAVRSSADKLRVTVQLVRAADGFELWSEDYDRSNNDVLAVEEDVARSIAGALKIATDPQALAQMQRAGTRSVPAYQAYLKSLALYFKANTVADYDVMLDAIKAAHEATAIDPAFGDAWGAAAFVEGIITDPTTIKTTRIEAVPFADLMRDQRADLNSAGAHARNPLERNKYQAILASLDVRLKDAVALMSDYLRANPDDRFAQDSLASWSIMTGDFARARVLAEALAKVDSLGTGNEPMYIMLRARDARRAGELARQALAQNPDSVEIVYQVHRVLLSVGATADAARLLPMLLASSLPDSSKRMLRIRQACAEGRTADAVALFKPDPNASAYDMTLMWQQLALLGRTDEAFHLLDRYDTPQELYRLSTHMVYPMFDARRFPLLMKTLAAQGIEPPLPQPESYACKPEATSR